MLERSVETHLRRRVRAAGGECLKFTSPGRRHVHDRLCLFAPGVVWWVETKRPGAAPRPGQKRFHARLNELGMLTIVLDTREKIDAWIACATMADVWRLFL